MTAKLDLAIASGSSGLSLVKILLGNGNGTFKQGVDVTLPGPSISVTLADFNGDHVPDLAASFCAKSSCKTYVFLGQGRGLFRLSAQLPYGGGTVVAGDFNADGHQEIAVLASNELVMFLGNANGSFQSPLLSSQNDPVGLAVGDFYNNAFRA